MEKKKREKEISTIKTDTAWTGGIDSTNNSECAQKNSKVTQKKQPRNRRSSKFYTHTHTHSNLKIFSGGIIKNNHLFRL